AILLRSRIFAITPVPRARPSTPTAVVVRRHDLLDQTIRPGCARSPNSRRRRSRSLEYPGTLGYWHRWNQYQELVRPQGAGLPQRRLEQSLSWSGLLRKAVLPLSRRCIPHRKLLPPLSMLAAIGHSIPQV